MGGLIYALGFFTLTGSIVGVIYSETNTDSGIFNSLISLLIGAASGVLFGGVILFFFIVAINIFPGFT